VVEEGSWDLPYRDLAGCLGALIYLEDYLVVYSQCNGRRQYYFQLAVLYKRVSQA
jgi:hypothetical protein